MTEETEQRLLAALNLPKRDPLAIQAAIKSELKARLNRTLRKEDKALRKELVEKIIAAELIVLDSEVHPKISIRHTVEFGQNGRLTIITDGQSDPTLYQKIHTTELLLRSLTSEINKFTASIHAAATVLSPTAAVQLGEKTYIVTLEVLSLDLDRLSNVMENISDKGEPDIPALISGDMLPGNTGLIVKIIRALLSMTKAGRLSDCDLAVLRSLWERKDRFPLGADIPPSDVLKSPIITGRAECAPPNFNIDLSLAKLEKLRIAWPHYKPARELKFDKWFSFSA